MPLDYHNPAVIQFLKDRYERENEQRSSWFMKNKENIIATTISRYNKNYHVEDIERAYIEPLIPNLVTHNQVCWPNRRRKYPLDNPIALAPERKISEKIISDKENIAQVVHTGAIMMPVDPDVTKILKVELPYGGRQEYLKERNKVLPEEKYYFCETSSNICGWHLKNSKVGYPISEYKRKALFFRDLRSRSGPHPDPPHYNETQNFSKCIS